MRSGDHIRPSWLRIPTRWLLPAIDLLTALLLVWYLLPAAREIGRSAFFAAAFGLWLVLALCAGGKWLRDAWLEIALLAAWFAVYAVNNFFGRDNQFFEYAYVMGSFFIPLLFCSFYRATGQTGKLGFFAWLVIVLVMVTAATTLVGQFRYPNSARIISTGRSDAALFSRMNIGGYGFSYGLMLFVIVFAGYIKHRTSARAKAPLYLLLLLLLFVLYRMEFTICLVLALLGVAATLFFTKKVGSALLMILAVLVVVFFVFESTFLELLNRAVRQIGSNTIKARLLELVQLMRQGDLSGDLNARVKLYTVSLKTISQHPLFGVGGYYGYDCAQHGIGGHAELIDMVARYGVVGAAPLVGFYAVNFRKTLKQYVGDPVHKGVAVMQLMFVVLSAVNVIFNGMEIGLFVFFAIPALHDMGSFRTAGEALKG